MVISHFMNTSLFAFPRGLVRFSAVCPLLARRASMVALLALCFTSLSAVGDETGDKAPGKRPTADAKPGDANSADAKSAEASSPSDRAAAKGVEQPAKVEPTVEPAAKASEEKPAPAPETHVTPTQPPSSRRQGLIAGITIFVLAIFVGFELINKVPTTLHTPLMSGSNAISGITVVGSLIAAGTLATPEITNKYTHSGLGFAAFLGFLAVILAMINVVGGFLVTHRMLLMFKRK